MRPTKASPPTLPITDMSYLHLFAAQLLAALLATAAHAQSLAPIDPPNRDPRSRIILVGDSTMAPNTGYGNALCARVTPALDCWNLARGGRSTKSFRAEGLWDQLIARMQAEQPAGVQWVLIQFGHNDQPGKPGRSTDLAAEYPANLARYVDEVRAVGGQPILVTPLTRRSFKGARLDDQLQPWADAMRRIASDKQVPLLELHALSMALVQRMGPVDSDLLAEAAPGERRFDRTHLGLRGACFFSEIVSEELKRLAQGLATPRQPAAPCASVAPPVPTQ